MTENTHPVLEKICTALMQQPNHRESAEILQQSQRGLLLFFLPAINEAKQASGWQTVIADLTSVYATLQQAGFSILVILPDVTAESFDKAIAIPFPLVHNPPDGDLTNTLWQLMKPEEPHIFEYAAFIDQDKNEVVKDWEKSGFTNLVSDVVLHLVKKKLLIYTVDTQIIQEVEQIGRAHV